MITGGHGFLGRQLVPLLQNDWKIHLVSRSGGTSYGAITLHKADLLVAGEVERVIEQVSPTHLVHLAWNAKHDTYWESPENPRWAERSSAIFEKFFNTSGQSAVGIGSCAEYDWSTPSPYKEHDPTGPRSAYGKAKDQLRRFLASKSEWRVAWARLFFLYGPHEQRERFVPYCLRNLLSGTSPALGSPDKIRDYLYVKDAALGLKVLLESSASGTYNLASGLPVSIGEMAKTMEQCLGTGGKITFDRSKVFPVGSEELVADISKIKTQWGWEPKYTLLEGMQETLAWWKNHENHN